MGEELKEIKMRHNHLNEYECEITDELNKHLTPYSKRVWSESGCFIHLFGGELKVHPLIRLPGATRGRINIDDNGVITSIEIYESSVTGPSGCFEESVKVIEKMFIGHRMVL